MITRVNIHPDEFQELSTLYSKESGYKIGFLKRGLQYVIWPLKYVSASEDQVMVAARAISYLGVLGIYWMLFKLGTLLADRRLGLAAVFICATFVNFLEASIQFRSDQLMTALFLLGLYLVLKEAPRRAIWVWPGLLMGLALFLNPKAVYHFGSLGLVYGYFLIFSKARKMFLTRGVCCALTTLVAFLGLVFFHSLFYQLSLDTLPNSFGKVAKVGFGKTLGWDLKIQFVIGSITRAIIPSLCILAGYVLVVRGLFKKQLSSRWVPIVWVGLAEAATVIFHQGVFKYYIVDILPISAILGGYPLYLLMAQERLQDKGLQLRRFTNYAAVGVFLLCLAGVVSRAPLNLKDTMQSQREYIRFTHELFPDPVNYIDGFGMVSKYNNVSALFIGKSITQYRSMGQPKFPIWLEQGTPVFFLNSQSFNFRHLLAEDQNFLYQNYLPFFGNRLWVLGFRLPAKELAAGSRSKILLSGSYHVRGNFDGLMVDGQPVEATFQLEEGDHEFSCHQCGDLEVTYGLKSPLDVVPNLTVPSRSTGSLNVEYSARYYLRGNRVSTQELSIDDRPVTSVRWPEKEVSIFLEAGDRRFVNATGQNFSLDVFGPIFVLEVWSIWY